MRKLQLLILAALFAFAASAQVEMTDYSTLSSNLPSLKKAGKFTVTKISSSKKAPKTAEETSYAVSLTYTPGLFYQEITTTQGNYYMILSSVPATYNSTTGEVTVEGAGWGVALDLYSTASSGTIAVPGGTYKLGNGSESFTYNAEYTAIYHFDGSGNSSIANLDGDITVTRNAGGSTVITFQAVYNGETYQFKYDGTPEFTGTTSSTHTLPQITTDVIEDSLTGARAIYYGNMYDSNTGNMVVNLYGGPFDAETGATQGPGNLVSLCLFGTLFANSSKAHVQAGTYTMARNFSRNSYYPGVEVNYMGITTIIGCLAQNRDSADNYTYACVTSGTVTVTEPEDDIYDITFDMMTDTGHKVKGHYKGAIPVNDQAQESSTHAIISTLDDDYVLNLDQIKIARVYPLADTVKCSHFVIDIGSVSGKDTCLVNNGGDYFRIDMLSAGASKDFTRGEYGVLPYSYYNYYEPMKLIRGYFANGGDIVGTRWGHFQEGRYLVMDGLAPMYDGNITLVDNPDGTTTINIDCVDDAGYLVQGTWTGQLVWMWKQPTNELAGDVNQDGKIDATDLSALSGRLLGENLLTNVVCDVNGDGKVNTSDLTLLLQKILESGAK